MIADPSQPGATVGYAVPVETAVTTVQGGERRGVLLFYNAFGHYRGYANGWSDLPAI